MVKTYPSEILERNANGKVVRSFSYTTSAICVRREARRSAEEPSQASTPSSSIFLSSRSRCLAAPYKCATRQTAA